MQQIIDAVDAVQAVWAEAEAMYRETNAIPRTEELSAHDWLIVEAVKQRLQMREQA